MAGDEPMGGIMIAMFAPALGEHIFLVSFEHRKPPDLAQIARAGFVSNRRRWSPGWSHGAIALNEIFCPDVNDAHIGSSGAGCRIARHPNLDQCAARMRRLEDRNGCPEGPLTSLLGY
jgi:hypothetical protein